MSKEETVRASIAATGKFKFKSESKGRQESDAGLNISAASEMSEFVRDKNPCDRGLSSNLNSDASGSNDMLDVDAASINVFVCLLGTCLSF